jgi:hypothetical protein
MYSAPSESGVLYCDPFAGVSDERLSCLQVEDAIFVRHAERAFEHDGELIEFRCLARFNPAARTAHVRDAEPRFAGVIFGLLSAAVLRVGVEISVGIAT